MFILDTVKQCKYIGAIISAKVHMTEILAILMQTATIGKTEAQMERHKNQSKKRAEIPAFTGSIFLHACEFSVLALGKDSSSGNEMP